MVGGVLDFARQRVVVAVERFRVGVVCVLVGSGVCGLVVFGVGFEAFGIGQRIAQDQAAFGIGVEDFDGLAGHRGDDVAGFVGVGIRHVFTGRDEADDVERQAQFADGAEGADDCAAAAHVVVHLVHLGRRLERNAAGVEGDRLANQYHGLVAFGAAFMFQHDETRRFVAAHDSG